jgi:hypothetical protein
VVEVDGEVWVVTFGSGELFRVADGQRMDMTTVGEGTLDGITLAGDQFLISSWASEAIYASASGGDAELAAVVTGVQSPADIDYDATRHVVLIPLFELDELRIVPVN